MLKTIITATIITATIFPATAIQANADTNKKYDLSILPADVAVRVVELQKHGDRFEAAIRAIFIAAVKPSSGFDCLEPNSRDAPQT
ncbi:hypothetical protein [Jannaschia seohaensis]|uniref:Uncharacterized protein n=1 Tax=Jannaschia seohaensis TaxID=475081 RepID=A0A2Y9A0I3_9RHOB|nr:hypothetical protein [Jannaschia seohaensis]PWJ21682.1 hypothetical protein BCF38_10188 [Jannaschia seohaensis]SSA37960.1 hypothetical protein SAMN05421539_10188 [Jannaschia seohaensis]